MWKGLSIHINNLRWYINNYFMRFPFHTHTIHHEAKDSIGDPSGNSWKERDNVRMKREYWHDNKWADPDPNLHALPCIYRTADKQAKKYYQCLTESDLEKNIGIISRQILSRSGNSEKSTNPGVQFHAHYPWLGDIKIRARYRWKFHFNLPVPRCTANSFWNPREPLNGETKIAVCRRKNATHNFS